MSNVVSEKRMLSEAILFQSSGQSGGVEKYMKILSEIYMKDITVEFLKRSAKTGDRVYLQLFFLRSSNNYFTEKKFFL